MKHRRQPIVRLLVIALAATLASVGPGCGVILGYQVPQPVTVQTAPPGALVRVSGVAEKQPTPTAVLIDPRTNPVIEAVKGDLRGSSAVRKRIRTGVVVLDGVFTLGIGVLVDFLTGALYEFDQVVRINLGQPPPSSSPTPVSPARPPPSDAAPCPVCGEPRGERCPCPACGIG